ncbi:fumarylacetoacetate hydrolase family protein [Ferviditalea candida]|uniref:Fumarylacetoacetate hydrolase family protein n=1 Tax=Ferviditalea candida TaxID=3108399 RepID=A0ABU5ZH25_9BACL|nr:fumarylacetoacetate hydrolase family protein [Paenibacillaceae bacterium T2]
MKLISFYAHGAVRAGCIHEDQVIDLNLACRKMLESQGKLRAAQIADAHVPADMTELLQGGDESLEMAREAAKFVLQNENSNGEPKAVYARSEVKLAAPVPKPGKIICVGHNYREHILEMKRELPEHPVIFAKFANTVIGPEDPIPYYPITQQLDYEAEFTFVMGKRARNVKQAEALDYVAGYTIVNDVSYRDLQRRTIQWLQGKTVDGSAPMGPWLVTRDELKNPHELEIFLTVNGEERQRSNTKNLVFNVNFLVEFLSGIMTLEPGDVICTGTPGGVGVARDPQVFLKDGDVVRVEIERIGALENTVRTAQ